PPASACREPFRRQAAARSRRSARRIRSREGGLEPWEQPVLMLRMRNLQTVVLAVVLAGVLQGLGVHSESHALAPAGKDFPVVGGNLGNQRYSSLAQITPSTVKRLGGAWMVHVEEGAATNNMQGTPVVVNGVLYIGSESGKVLAIDAATGARIWTYQSS